MRPYQGRRRGFRTTLSRSRMDCIAIRGIAAVQSSAAARSRSRDQRRTAAACAWAAACERSVTAACTPGAAADPEDTRARIRTEVSDGLSADALQRLERVVVRIAPARERRSVRGRAGRRRERDALRSERLLLSRSHPRGLRPSACVPVGHRSQDLVGGNAGFQPVAQRSVVEHARALGEQF